MLLNTWRGVRLLFQFSEIIKSLTETHTAEKNEELHHYVISTNEGEWLEIVSDNIRIEANGG